MNRLTVYSYLTRFTNGNTMYGKLFAEPVAEYTWALARTTQGHDTRHTPGPP